MKNTMAIVLITSIIDFNKEQIKNYEKMIIKVNINDKIRSECFEILIKTKKKVLGIWEDELEKVM